MKNVDIMIFKTRDGLWGARVSHSGTTEYIDKCASMSMLMKQIERALILREVGI